MGSIVSRGAAGALVLGLALGSAPALASLGGSRSAIPAEQAAMRAAVQVSQNQGYALHTLTLPNGGVVRQFVNDAGQVFAVTWSGPGKPDLRMLLGGHFAALEPRAGAGHPGRSWRRPARVNESGLQIQTGGHMGYFWGVALVPGLTPAGFDRGNLK